MIIDTTQMKAMYSSTQFPPDHKYDLHVIVAGTTTNVQLTSP